MVRRRLSILAILAVYNEEVHIRRCIRDLVADGIDVCVLDNGSTDSTTSITEEYLGKGVVAIRRTRRQGAFSLSAQLDMKRRIARGCDYDWIIHIDADERMESCAHHDSLRQGIEAADAAGCNCVNFRELVFVPLPGEDFYTSGYADRMCSYYLFEPWYPRLNRAWKRDAALDSSATGGHVLRGANVRMYSDDFILRHYIVLSEMHARRKYLCRRYSDADLKRGWHGNRRSISDANLCLQWRPEIKHLRSAQSRDYDLGDPLTGHFWEWPDDSAGRLAQGGGR